MDLSLLTSVDPLAGEENLQASLTMTGVYWDNGTHSSVPMPDIWLQSTISDHNPLTSDPVIRDMQDAFYPWNWAAPSALRLFWLEKTGETHTLIRDSDGHALFTDIGIAPAADGRYGNDLRRLKEYSQAHFNATLWPAAGSPPYRFDPCAVHWDGATRDVDFTDAEVPQVNTGFLKAAVAQAAQRIPPLNTGLLLAFLGAGRVTAPAGATHVMAVPTGGTWWTAASGSPFEPYIDAVRGQIDYAPALLTQYHADLRLVAACGITALKDDEPLNNESIQLRDPHGDFLGHVQLQVHDVEDQLPSLMYAAGRFFDLPRWFHAFLSHHREKLARPVGVPFDEYRLFVGGLNGFLWSSVRDSLGFGYRDESDGNSLLRRVVRKYCDDYSQGRAQVHMLDEGQQATYWTDYNHIMQQIKDAQFWETQDSASKISDDYWKKVFSPYAAGLPGTGLPGPEVCGLPFLEKAVRDYGRDLGLARISDEAMKSVADLLDIPSTEDALSPAWISQWLAGWAAFLDTLEREPLLQQRMLFCQWKALPWKEVAMDQLDLSDLDIVLEAPPGETASARKVREAKIARMLQQLQWYEQVFSAAGDLRELQKEALAVSYKAPLVQALKDSLMAGPDVLVERVVSGIGQYAAARIGSPEKYFPVLADPLSWPGISLSWNDFMSFLQDPAAATPGMPPQQQIMREALQKEIEITFDVPPFLQLKVDALEGVASGPAMAEDGDLNDEIAGHIVVMRRGNTINDPDDFHGQPWRYLNWAQVEIVQNNGSYALQNRYVHPVCLPETDGAKNAFLQLSNEKLSLISGHRTHMDQDGIPFDGCTYLFDYTRPSYALWYGFHYKFAGFVALNSGVLPAMIREAPDAWNIPLTDEAALTALQIPHEASYYHLRRVPVSKVRVDVHRVEGTALSNVLPLPRGLMPLAFELPEWKSNILARMAGGPNPAIAAERMAVRQQEQVHYLLADGAERYDQKEIRLTLRKPTTSFWNWYAWLGKDTDAETRDRFPEREDTTGRKRPTDQQGHMLDKGEDGRYYLVDEDGHRILDEQGRDIESSPYKRVKHIALERELLRRSGTAAKSGHAVDDPLIDTALENTYIVSMQKLFPEREEIKWGTVTIPGDPGDPLFVHGLRDVASTVHVQASGTAQTDIQYRSGREINKIVVRNGDVVAIKIYGLIRKEAFGAGGPGQQRFHPFMQDVVASGDVIPGLEGFDDCLLARPQELWIEAAARPRSVERGDPNRYLFTGTQKELNEALWSQLTIRAEPGKTVASINRNLPTHYVDLAYTSRAEIRHQLWSWNGRVDESALLTADPVLDPTAGRTTAAMRWEAWAFSDRPDFSALVQEANLLAYRHDGTADATTAAQDLYVDLRPGEEKALYYRFSVTLRSRYELLGKDFSFSITSAKDVRDPGGDAAVPNLWRRHLRKCARSTRLPKPSVRFVIPLTKSIDQCSADEHISPASLLVVLDDRWFSEAGLAEQFEFGIEVLADGQRGYLNAGYDPILYGTSLGPLKTLQDHGARRYPYLSTEVLPATPTQPPGTKTTLVMDAKGPAGLTFDFTAQTPRLKGCAFIIDVPDLDTLVQMPDKAPGRLAPWALMQVAVRRALRADLCEPSLAAAALCSEWSAKQWVQFLPSIDSFIPRWWRQAVALDGSVAIRFGEEGRRMDVWNREGAVQNGLPALAGTASEYNQQFLVLTERVYDIGGQPCEKYVGTYLYDRARDAYYLDHKDTPVQLHDVQEGYMRILMVRSSKYFVQETNAGASVWERLFGKEATSGSLTTAVQEDASAALPLVSERIPFKTI